MKLKFKKLFSLIALFFCVIVMGGCAQIDYSRFIYPNGKIVDRVVVEIDEKAYNYCSFSKKDFLTIIQKDFENIYIQPIEDFKTEFWSTEHTFAEKQLVQDGIITDVREVDGVIFCDVTFLNQEVFDLYYKSLNIDADVEKPYTDAEFREGTFVNKFVTSSENAYAVLKTKALQNLISKYKGYFQYHYGLSNLKLTQEYASPNTSIYSNAQETEIVDGVKMHYWEIDPTNLDFELEFYTVTPHTTSWYILAFILSLLSIFIVWAIVRRRNQIAEEKANACNVNPFGSNNRQNKI
jgi:hypothetical protein